MRMFAAMLDTSVREKTGEEMLGAGGGARAPAARLTLQELIRASGKFPQFSCADLVTEHELVLKAIKDGQDKMTRHALLGALIGSVLCGVVFGLASGEVSVATIMTFLGAVIGMLIGALSASGSPAYPHLTEAKNEFRYLRFVREEMCRRAMELPQLAADQLRYVAN